MNRLLRGGRIRRKTIVMLSRKPSSSSSRRRRRVLVVVAVICCRHELLAQKMDFISVYFCLLALSSGTSFC